jgi:hypothetical protein
LAASPPQAAGPLAGEYGDVFGRYLTVEEASRPVGSWRERISGTVVDAETGRPVAGAIVTLSYPWTDCAGTWYDRSSGVRVVSDQRGRFDFAVPSSAMEDQVRLAGTVPREEAEANGAVFGAFDVHASHGDYVRASARDVVPSEPLTIDVEPVAGKLGLMWIALDAETGLALTDAWVELELLRDPPFPAGPQRLPLPFEIWIDPLPVRGTVGADGYESIEVEVEPGPGPDRRRFRLEKAGG